MNKIKSKDQQPSDSSSKKRSRRIPNSRYIWSEKQEKLLYDIIEDQSIGKSWDSILSAVRKEIPDFDYRPEDCMRRYKQYINPFWYSEYWPTDQGFILSIFVKVFGSNWVRLGELLSAKDHKTLEDYYYSLMHKAIRHASYCYVPWSVLDKAANFFEWILMLDEVKRRYFKGSYKDDKGVNWIRTSQLDAKKLKIYRGFTIKKFCEVQGNEKIPLIVKVDLNKIGLKEMDAKIVAEAEANISANIKEVIHVKFSNCYFESKPPAKPKLNFSFPVYRSMLPVNITKRIYPEPIMYPDYSQCIPHINLQSQMQAGIMIQGQDFNIPMKHKAVEYDNQPVIIN